MTKQPSLFWEKNESRIFGKQKAYISYYNVYNPFYIKFNKMEYMNSNLDQIWKKRQITKMSLLILVKI